MDTSADINRIHTLAESSNGQRERGDTLTLDRLFAALAIWIHHIYSRAKSFEHYTHFRFSHKIVSMLDIFPES